MEITETLDLVRRVQDGDEEANEHRARLDEDRGARDLLARVRQDSASPARARNVWHGTCQSAGMDRGLAALLATYPTDGQPPWLLRQRRRAAPAAAARRTRWS